MIIGHASARTAVLLLCATAACSTENTLENGSPAIPEAIPEHPVTASIVTSDTLEPVADAFTRSFAPNVNYGTVDSLTVRSFSASASRFSVYVRFDQAAIEARVGTGQLDSARLEFSLRDGGSWPAAGDC